MSELTMAEGIYRAVRQEVHSLSDLRLGHRYRKLRGNAEIAVTTQQLVELAALRHAMQARGLEVAE